MDTLDKPILRINKKKSPSDKLKKYVKARAMGKNKTEAKMIAGYSPATPTTTIEKTDSYKELSIKDALLGVISKEQLAHEHLKNIVQDSDRGAKNTAIKMAYERIEPENRPLEDADKIVVVLASNMQAPQIKDAQFTEKQAEQLETSEHVDATTEQKS